MALSRKINNIYDKVHLNLGIKRWLNRILFPKWHSFVDVLDSRVFAPIATKLYMYLFEKLIYRFGGAYRQGNYKSHNLDMKTGNLGYGLIHYSLIRNIKPKHLLCVGSMYGFIPALCALACKHNLFGTVDFVDAGYDVNNPDDREVHTFGEGFWKKNDPKKHFSYLGIQKHINTYVMTTKDYSVKYPKRRYEYIYIDGDHSYLGVKKDFNYFWKRLNKGGFIAFHDTDNNGKQGNLYYNVGKFLEETIYKHKRNIHFTNPASGLVIAQKL